MRPLPIFRQLTAIVLVLSILTLRIGAVTHVTFVEPIQNFISKKPLLKEDTTRQKVAFFKIKRVLYDLNFGEGGPILQPHLPSVSTLMCGAVFRAIPEVYLDIFRPPDEPA